MEETDHWRHALKGVYCPTPSSQCEQPLPHAPTAETHCLTFSLNSMDSDNFGQKPLS